MDATWIGRYEVLGELGAGAYGKVLRARDPLLGRQVAIKVLSANDSARSRSRFEREATAAAALRHPNVVAIHEAVLPPEGVAYLVSDIAEGGSLAQRLERGPLSGANAAQVFRGAVAGVAALHSVGIVHRDLKPANLLFSGEQIQVTDFGVAFAVDRETRLTRTGELVGTPSYMAPEQIRGAAVTPATDVYALGVTLFEILTGDLPHPASSLVEQIHQVLEVPAPAPASRVPGLDPQLNSICLRCLAKDPADRFPDAGALLAALDAGHPRRALRLWALTSLGLALLAGLIWFALPPSQPTPLVARSPLPSRPSLAKSSNAPPSPPKGYVLREGPRLWPPVAGLESTGTLLTPQGILVSRGKTLILLSGGGRRRVIPTPTPVDVVWGTSGSGKLLLGASGVAFSYDLVALESAPLEVLSGAGRPRLFLSPTLLLTAVTGGGLRAYDLERQAWTTGVFLEETIFNHLRLCNEQVVALGLRPRAHVYSRLLVLSRASLEVLHDAKLDIQAQSTCVLADGTLLAGSKLGRLQHYTLQGVPIRSIGSPDYAPEDNFTLDAQVPYAHAFGIGGIVEIESGRVLSLSGSGRQRVSELRVWDIATGKALASPLALSTAGGNLGWNPRDPGIAVVGCNLGEARSVEIVPIR